MPAAIQELHAKGMDYPVLIGGAAINRAFSFRALYPGGKEATEEYAPGVFYCKDAFEGLGVMDQLIDEEAREALRVKLSAEATAFREKGEDPDEDLDYSDSSVRSAVRTDNPVPEPPFWGVREIPVDMDELYSHLDTHVLFKLHWGGRGVKGEAWQKLLDGDGEEEGFRHRLERMWREQDYLHPRALLGFFPCYAEGNDIVVLDPEDRETELTRFVTPRQPKGDRLCTADFFRTKESGELDVIALQALTVGSEVTELMAQLEKDGEFAEQLFVHGLGVQTAEGLSEWLHWKVRGWLGIPATQGRRLSWGYPAIPEQSDHKKVEELLDLSQVGMEISDGYAPIPEQSTLAMVLHHPQAIYYGMRNGRLLPDGSPDDVIKGSKRDPSLFAELPDEDPPEGAVESEDAPAIA
jgi:5-methyltetrahydrofolate--homocysteine methyltransferase